MFVYVHNDKLQKQYHIATLRHKLTQHMNTENFATETIQLFLDFSQIIMICFMQYEISNLVNDVALSYDTIIIRLSFTINI